MKFLYKTFESFIKKYKKNQLGTNSLIDLSAHCANFSCPLIITEFSVDKQTILWANDHHEKLTGYSANEIIGLTPRIFQGKKTSEHDLQKMKEGLSKRDFWVGEVLNYKKSGAEQIIKLEIFAVSINTDRYYVARKTRVN